MYPLRPLKLAHMALPVVVLLSALAVACGGDGDDATPTETGTVVTGTSETATVGATASAAAAFPVTLENCGFSVTIEGAPERAVSMNQAATEIMLALGLEDRMAGTAYLDDEILPEYSAAYGSVPVLAAEYPSRESLLGGEPDFVYGSYASAFGDEAAGSRDSLEGLGIGSYVSPAACEDRSLRPAEVTFDTVFGEIRDIGMIFGVSGRAEALIGELEAELEAATQGGAIGEGLSVVWYDGGTEAPMVGACCGAPGLIMKTVGLENTFEDVDGSWSDVSWEEFVDRNPDLIVLGDASWDSAEDKKILLAGDPATQTMEAVQQQRYVELPFSATTPGIRNVTAVIEIAEFIDATFE